ncbi:MAG: hypothetical protein AAGE13_09685 [Pseudomonadota bacterium]
MSVKETSPDDPRGLIHDAFRMDGLGAAECRSIYLDWAIGMPQGTDLPASTARLLTAFAQAHPDHPMTAVLREGTDRKAAPPRRRSRPAR